MTIYAHVCMRMCSPHDVYAQNIIIKCVQESDPGPQNVQILKQPSTAPPTGGMQYIMNDSLMFRVYICTVIQPAMNSFDIRPRNTYANE